MGGHVLTIKAAELGVLSFISGYLMEDFLQKGNT